MIILIIILLFYSAVAEAVNYHIATNGSNSNSCSAAQSTSTPKQTFDSGIRCLSTGDTLYARGGTYIEDINSNNYAGNSFPVGTSFSNAVTIASYPNETATIRGSGGDAMINLPHAYIKYVIFDRLVLDAANYFSGISSGSSGANHIRFSNGEIKNAIHNGMLVEGVGNEALNSLFHNNGVNNQLDHGIYWNGSDGLIEGNQFYGNAAFGLQLYDGTNFDVNNNIIRNNIMRNNMGQGGATLSAGSNNLFYNNLVYGNGVLGVQVSSGGPNNQQIYNNTIYNNNGSGILIKVGSTSTKIKNNIIYLNSGSAINDQSTGSTTDATNNLTSNPLFVDAAAANFRLQSGSAAIDAGANLAAIFTTSFYGVTRPSGAGFDIGAAEFDSGSSPNPTWIFCAFEGDTCSFSGLKEVRYGSPDLHIWVSAQFTNGVVCNQVTGYDPAVGQGKECYYRDFNLQGGIFE